MTDPQPAESAVPQPPAAIPPPGAAAMPPPGAAAMPPPGAAAMPPPGGTGAPAGPYVPPPPPAYTTARAPQNGVGIASLVAGILSLGIGWIPFIGWFGTFAGIIAIVLGVIGLNQVKKGQATNKAMCWWGIGLGIASFVLAVIGVVIFGLLLATSGSST